MTINYLGELVGEANNVEGTRTYRRTFELEVTTTAEAKRPYLIGSDGNLPLIGQLYSDDNEAWLRSLKVRPGKPYKQWFVDAMYTTERAARDSNGNPVDQSNPLAIPAQFDWSGEQFQRPAILDRFGEMVGNAAGDPYDPPELIDDSRLMCRVEKNVATVPQWILDFQDAVNVNTFNLDGLTVQPQQAKFQRLSIPRPSVRNGYKYHKLTFEIHLRRETWKLKPLNQGFRDNTGAMIKVNGDYPTAPIPLKADGSGALDPPSLAAANFTEHEVYEALAFSQLPLT